MVQEQVKGLMGLAFIKLRDLDKAIALLLPILHEKVKPLANYFVRVWLGQEHLVGGQPPLFPRKMWNCHER